MLTVLVSTCTLSNTLLFFLCKSYSHFFSKNISMLAIFNDQSFNDTITNVSVSFELLGPGCFKTATVLSTSFRKSFFARRFKQKK